MTLDMQGTPNVWPCRESVAVKLDLQTATVSWIATVKLDLVFVAVKVALVASSVSWIAAVKLDLVSAAISWFAAV